MSTPMNPNQPQGGAHYPPQQPTMGGAGDQQTAVDSQQMPQGGFMPGQGAAGQSLDSGAPTHARLPKRLADDAGRTNGIPFGRLLGVEMRKMYDTRAGKWLIGLTIVLIAAISMLVAWYARDESVRFWDLLGASMMPFAYLLPILGILTVTSEWSQRTGLNTFTLEPRRERVVFAKWGAAIVLTLAAVVASFVIAALFTFIGGMLGSGAADWSSDLSAAGIAKIVLLEVLYVTMGIAFGLLLQNTPGAICAYLFIPMVVSLANLFEWARTPLEWVNPSQSFNSLSLNEMPDNGWAKVGVSALIWIVLPMVIGFIRLNKREVKSS